MSRAVFASVFASLLIACGSAAEDPEPFGPGDVEGGDGGPATLGADAGADARADARDVCEGRADGTYCGERLGGEVGARITCQGAKTQKREVCATGCFVREPGKPEARDDVCANDAVDPCFNDPDGVRCGVEIGGDAKTLFTCVGKRTAKREACKDGCYSASDPKAPDACASDAVDPCFNDADGTYCGNAIGGPAGQLYRCAGKRTASVEACGAPGCIEEPGARADICNGVLSCANVQWWNVPLTYGPYMSSGGWWDTDLLVRANTPVVLRHASKLDKTGVYGWGYMPEFTDQATGKRFRMLHLRPSAQNATDVGRIYPAGFVVGISGGDTADTGLPRYSTGAHLCIQTLELWRTVFPDVKDSCKP
ncbi:MAG: hypothetical protein IPF92_01005 [Myxococcales bacterium]|nr:hypothetical protein [Myxococcales bacterium]MBL0193709.1 hypothetical protein [Myxococcales bacterium]HQY61035.1 hypothetical protein [Polyangiaceae bacterium]